jgi:hypothetical protein
MKRAVVVVVLIAGLGASCDQPPPSDASPPTTVTEPKVAIVPNVLGLRGWEGVQRLKDSGLRASLERRPSREPVGTIMSQHPAAGAGVDEGTSVTLVVAKSLPRVPYVVGLRVSQARRIVGRKGFEIRVRRQTSSAPTDTVISQSPSGGIETRLGRQVTIIVAKSPPPPDGGGAGDGGNGRTDDSLSPASDYDCAGGTGDGPEYVPGPITIVGSDQYGLDADGDGVGCE